VEHCLPSVVVKGGEAGDAKKTGGFDCEKGGQENRENLFEKGSFAGGG